MLSVTDKAILDLEAERYKYQGAREAAIRSTLGLSAVHYYQRLNHLIDTEAAVAYKPMLVKSLQGRRRSRGARR